MRIVPNKKPAALRMTPQRAEILKVLDGNRTHPSAEEIYARVARKFRGVSFATVYNTLQALTARGELLRVTIDGARDRFDPCTAAHAHLRCVKCGRIADLKAPRRAPVPAGKPAGFKVLRYDLQFHGVCPACGKTPGRKENKSCAKKRKK